MSSNGMPQTPVSQRGRANAEVNRSVIEVPRILANSEGVASSSGLRELRRPDSQGSPQNGGGEATGEAGEPHGAGNSGDGGLLSPWELANALVRNRQVKLPLMFQRQSVERELRDFLDDLLTDPNQKYASVLKSMISYIWCKEFGDARDTVTEILIGMGHDKSSPKFRADAKRMLTDLSWNASYIDAGGEDVGKNHAPNRPMSMCTICNMPESTCEGRCRERKAMAAVAREEMAYIEYLASTSRGTWRLDESDNGAWTCMSCHRLSAECGGSCMPAGGRVRGGHGAAGDGGQLARVPPALGGSTTRPAPPGTPHRSCDGTARRGHIDFDSPFSTQPCLSPPQSFGARTMASSPGPEDLLEALGLKRPARTVLYPSPEPEAPEPPLKRYRYCCKQAPRQADRVASCCTRRDPQAGT